MIRLRFSAGTGPAALLVRTVTWSWCAHVGFSLNDGFVLDATPEHGVDIRKTVDDSTTLYFDVDVPHEPIMAVAMTQIGKPYDFRGCLGIGLHRDWQDEGYWFCSELVTWVCLKAGFPILRVDHVDRITPRDLLLSPHLIPVQHPLIMQEAQYA